MANILIKTSIKLNKNKKSTNCYKKGAGGEKYSQQRAWIKNGLTW